MALAVDFGRLAASSFERWTLAAQHEPRPRKAPRRPFPQSRLQEAPFAHLSPHLLLVHSMSQEPPLKSQLSVLGA